MDKQLERNVDYAKDGIDALVQEIERLEDLVSAKETEIENLEETIEELKGQLNENI